MTSKRMGVAFIIALLLVMGMGMAHGDSDSPAYCATLSAEDCEILKRNEAVDKDSDSVAFDLSSKLEASIAEGDGPAESFSAEITGSGRLALEREVMDSWADIGGDVSAEALAGIIQQTLDGLAGELTLNVTIVTSEETVELPIILLMDGGVYMLDTAVLASVEGAEMMAGGEWLGLNAVGLGDALMAMPDFSSSVLSLWAAAEQESMMLDGADVKRLPDGEVNGLDVAVFEYALDVPLDDALLAEESAEGALSMMGDMRGSARNYVGLADYHTHRMTFELESEFDGAEMGNAEMGSMSMRMSMAIDLSEHGAPIEVEMPEDVFVLPLAMLIQMDM